jgi:hypothetical protein
VAIGCLGQPKAGWEEAERTVHGYSKTKEYQQKKAIINTRKRLREGEMRKRL